MKIREVLDADWTVDKLVITVRDKRTSRFIMRYCIGRDVKPGKSERFLYETELGDVHGDGGMNTLYMRRIIQYLQQEKKPQGKELCVGVLLGSIPKEILELPVEYMRPYGCGHSDEMHGYRIDSYVDAWSGIPGETKQMKLELIRKQTV